MQTRTLWAQREIDAPAEVLWRLLTDVEEWPAWGTTVSGVVLRSGPMGPGATGTLTTLFGVKLGFEITRYEEGSRWTWKVGGVPATDPGHQQRR